MSKFKVGDRVEFEGVKATISDLRVGESIYAGQFQVIFDDGDSGIIHPIDLKLIGTSPIRTVTRKEIVPGVYGKVEVSLHPDGNPCIMVSYPKTATELREAAHILNQIAEALEDD